jgi:hypothetical protein
VASIDTLPVIQSPEMFGLHANADISYYTSAAKAMWSDLVALQARRSPSSESVRFRSTVPLDPAAHLSHSSPACVSLSFDHA